MNTEYLRRALKTTWLRYYRDNRPWLVRLGIWVNCDGHRRPSSSFILGTLSTLEPQLTDLLPLIVDLSSNPDRIIAALDLNFSPDDELEAFEQAEKATNGVRMLPGGDAAFSGMSDRTPDRVTLDRDAACQGVRNDAELRT